jgi:electron transport complex protein RnfA
VLVKFYGICPFLGVSKKLDSAVGMSGAVIFVMFMATAVTFPLQIFVLDPAGLSYLQTIVFILVIAVLLKWVKMDGMKYMNYAMYLTKKQENGKLNI